MKKIIFIAPHISGKGGTETVLKTVVKQMSNSREYQPQIYLVGGSIDISWLNGLTYQSSKYYSNKLIRNVYYFITLYKYLLKEKPDIVVSLDPMICLMTKVARSLSLLKYPIISWIHFSINSPKVRKNLIPMADYHFAISTGIAKQLAELNINKKNIFTVLNPIASTSRVVKRPSDKTVFLYIGRILFEGQKRLKDLFDALSKLEGDWQLDIYGDGSDKEKCQKYTVQLGIADKINWKGFVSDPWVQIKEATALILTSSYEGLPMVLAEAISRGVYCISSNCETGPDDIIKENVNGNLYSVNHLEELKNTLQELINGKQLPNHQKIKDSIKELYINEYYNNFLASLRTVENTWNK